MATTNIDSWAVDLKEIGAIYPFQGSEGLLVVIGLASWIAWHVWCARWEKRPHDEQVAKFGDQENLGKASGAH